MKKLRGPLRKKNSRLWRRHPEDWYVEPQWCDERLFEEEEFEGAIYDPACGMGRVVRAARAAGHAAWGTDIAFRGFPCKRRDFFACTMRVPNIATNPPYRVGWAFAAYALVLAQRKVALLLPDGWRQGDERSRWLERTPLKCIWSISPRPSMPPGTVISAGEKPGNGVTDYAWFVWEQGYTGAPVQRWLRRDDEAREAASP